MFTINQSLVKLTDWPVAQFCTYTAHMKAEHLWTITKYTIDELKEHNEIKEFYH